MKLLAPWTTGLCSLLFCQWLLAMPVLYGVDMNGGDGGNISASGILYEIDPITGSGTQIGQIGYAVNSIAVDPTTGFLYGFTTAWFDGFRGLLRIDPTTGAGTEIGPRNIHVGNLTFNSSGELFAYQANGKNLVSIDLGTGAGTVVGSTGVEGGTQATPAMAFDNADNLMLFTDNGACCDPSFLHDVSVVNTTTGAATLQKSTNIDPGDGSVVFDATTGLLWGSSRGDSNLYITDVAAETQTFISTDVPDLRSIAFGVVPVPAAAWLFGPALGLLGWMRRKAA